MMRTRAAAIVAALALAACGSSSHPRSTAAARPPNRLVATFRAPGHSPRANVSWPVTVTARDPSGSPVHAHVRYAFLFGGVVVARRSNYAIDGVFHDTIVWPPDSVGRSLTLRVIVSSAIGTRAMDYPVRPVR